MKDIYNQIKWAYQRVFRGHDDRAYWNLDFYLASIALPVLKDYKDNKYGLMFNHEYDGDDPMNEGYHSEESQRELFDQMIFAMNAIVNELPHENLEQREQIREGCRLFGEYFQALWS